MNQRTAVENHADRVVKRAGCACWKVMAMRSNKFARKFPVSGPARRRLERWDAGTNGAWLMIVLVGFVLILVAAILQIKAFFSLPESPPAQPTAQVQTI